MPPGHGQPVSRLARMATARGSVPATEEVVPGGVEPTGGNQVAACDIGNVTDVANPGKLKTVTYNKNEHTLVVYKKRSKKEIGKGRMECPKCGQNQWAATGACQSCHVNMKQARDAKRAEDRSIKLNAVQEKGGKGAVNASHVLHNLRKRIDNIYGNSGGIIQVACFTAVCNPKQGGKLNYSLFGAGPAGNLYTTFPEMEASWANTCKCLKSQKELKVQASLEQLLKASDCRQYLVKCQQAKVTCNAVSHAESALLMKDVGFTLPKVWRLKGNLKRLSEDAEKEAVKGVKLDFVPRFDPALEAPADPSLPGELGCYKAPERNQGPQAVGLGFLGIMKE